MEVFVREKIPRFVEWARHICAGMRRAGPHVFTHGQQDGGGRIGRLPIIEELLPRHGFAQLLPFGERVEQAFSAEPEGISARQPSHHSDKVVADVFAQGMRQRKWSDIHWPSAMNFDQFAGTHVDHQVVGSDRRHRDVEVALVGVVATSYAAEQVHGRDAKQREFARQFLEQRRCPSLCRGTQCAVSKFRSRGICLVAWGVHSLDSTPADGSRGKAPHRQEA